MFGDLSWLSITGIVLVGLVGVAASGLRVRRALQRRRLAAGALRALQRLPEHAWVRGKTVLCVVNPFGGDGRGRWAFDNVVRPVLEAAGGTVDVHETTGAGCAHAHVAMHGGGLTPRYDAIICMSGDGIVHEVINGIVEGFRSEGGTPEATARLLATWTRECPLAVLPLGTSNGLATSFGYRDELAGVLALVEGSVHPIDISSLSFSDSDGQEPWQPSQWSSCTGTQVVWDCFMLNWAMVAEHDDWQERRLRWLPVFIRDIVAPLTVIAQRKIHPGTLYVRPCADPGTDYHDPAPGRDVGDGWRAIDGPFLLCSTTNTPWVTYDVMFSPEMRLAEGAIDVCLMDCNTSRWALAQVFLAMDTTASHVHHPRVTICKVNALRLEMTAGPHTPRISLSGELAPVATSVDVVVHPASIHFLF